MSQPSEQSLPFSYEDFSDWFDRHSKLFLHPAKDAATAALEGLLKLELQEPQQVRIRVGSGRVKSKTRTWKKLNDKYSAKVSAVSDIPAVVDDLVGLRVVCTNKSDVDRLVEILEGLDSYSDGDEPVLATYSGSKKDWRSDPKDSGYRAYHVNLCTSVAHATQRHPVVCELQIRTLLQDSWGELTHEDTYKPGTEVPPLVDTLSKRMADLMATLDDIAEDLRSELDNLAADSLTDPGGVSPGKPDSSVEEGNKKDFLSSHPAREGAEAYLRERVEGLSHPVALATLAWELQREFGGEISNGWLGYGTFMKMLQSVVPDVKVGGRAPGSPSYAVPAHFDASSYEHTRPGFPSVVSTLKEADQSFPLIRSKQWPRVYSALATATHQISWEGRPDVKILSELTKSARDGAGGSPQEHVSRPQVRYVAHALISAGRLITDMTATQVEDAFVEWMLSRAATLGVPEKDSEQLDPWLRGKGSS